MANLSTQVSPNNLYVTGISITLSDGRQLLKRTKYVYSPTGNKDRTHIVKDTDTIWSIAFERYGDDGYWFLIADANLIFNPMELTIGQELIIPDLEKAKLQLV